MELSGKKIILSVTGGIAAYKSVTLLRLLTKEGAEVQVLMTPTARQFVTPVTFSALSGKTVLSDFFDAGGGDWNSHVDLGVEADLMIIAPATATTMGKLANGIADNLVVATYLSAPCPVPPHNVTWISSHPTVIISFSPLRANLPAASRAKAECRSLR